MLNPVGIPSSSPPRRPTAVLVFRPPFVDDDGSIHEFSIEDIAEAGITVGCGGNRFCPDQAVTRGQMASFLTRALDLPASPDDWFDDDDNSVHDEAIDSIAEAGITKGFSDGTFRPEEPVTRAQMASFLDRGFLE
jgi:S-layer homology domain